MIDCCLKFASEAEWLANKAKLPADATIDVIGEIRELEFNLGKPVASKAIPGYHVNIRCESDITPDFLSFIIVPANPVRVFA